MLTLGALVIAVYFAFPTVPVRLAAVETAAVAAVCAILLGIRLYRPAPRLPWYLLATGLFFWGVVAESIWLGTLLLDGAPPSPGSLPDLFYVIGFASLIAALACFVRARDSSLASLLDAAMLALGIFIVAWVFLIGPYGEANDLPLLARATQIAYAGADVVVFALLLRLLLISRRFVPSLLLLAASAVSLLSSDGIWSWLTLLGTYATGSWPDTGWWLFLTFAGAAALHPSMAGLARTDAGYLPRPRPLQFLTLSAVSLTGPLVLVLERHELDEASTLAIAAGTGGLVLLVVARMTLLVYRGARLAQQLAEQNERLRQLDALKDDFLASISHELRTPLTSIHGYLCLLEEMATLGEEERSFLAVTKRNTERLTRLVTDLLFVAQVHAGQLTLDRRPVEIEQVVRESGETMLPRAVEKRVELILDIQPVPPLSGDRARLAQLFDNLISNAVKFTPPGGRVEVRTRCEESLCVVEVCDSGIGVPVDELDRLFERFYRASTARRLEIPGTGLGLTISKAIVDGHDGQITVTSTPEVETIFRLELPLIVAAHKTLAA